VLFLKVTGILAAGIGIAIPVLREAGLRVDYIYGPDTLILAVSGLILGGIVLYFGSRKFIAAGVQAPDLAREKDPLGW
jgi:hypothetical protein